MTKIGDPKRKIRAFDRSADCQLGGFDVMRLIAPERAPAKSGVGLALAVMNWDIFRRGFTGIERRNECSLMAVVVRLVCLGR